uniref:DZF domain-containing protein n=1 Tax=Rhabditophanes sp. KR3021 TaxID=114890 RepID=A0AC35UGD8_9BILA
MPTFRDKSEIPSYFNGTARLQPVYDEYLDPKMYKMLTEGNQKYYKELADTIGNLYESIIPSTIQTQNINVLINLIKLFLSKITVSPDSFNGCTISHIQPIGSFAYGTLRSVSCIADMAVVLKTLPTQESILLLAKAITADVTTKGQVECNFQLWEFGFVLKSNDVCVRIFIGTIPSNLNLLNPTMHYDLRILNKTDLFIKSSKWFEQNCTNPLLVALVTGPLICIHPNEEQSGDVVAADEDIGEEVTGSSGEMSNEEKILEYAEAGETEKIDTRIRDAEEAKERTMTVLRREVEWVINGLDPRCILAAAKKK